MKTRAEEYKTILTIDKESGKTIGEAWFRKSDGKIHRDGKAALIDYDLDTGNPFREEFVTDGNLRRTIHRDPKTGEITSEEEFSGSVKSDSFPPPPRLNR